MISFFWAAVNIFTTKNVFNLISNGSLIQLLCLLFAQMLVVNKKSVRETSMSYFLRRKRKSMNIWHWVKQQTKIKTPPGARRPGATTCFFSWTGTARSSVRCATNTIVWTVECLITVGSRARNMRLHIERIRMMKSSWSLSVDRNLNSARSATTGFRSHMGAIKWSAGVGGDSAIYVEGTITNAIAQRVIAEKRETNTNRINLHLRREYH